MTPLRWNALALTALVALASLASAQTTSATLTAESLSLTQGTWEGISAIASFLDKTGQQALSVHIQAASIEAQVMHDGGYGGEALGQGLPPTTRLPRSAGASSPDESWSMTNVVGQLQAEGDAQLHVRGPIDVEGTADDIEASGILAPRLGPDGVAAGAPVAPQEIPGVTNEDGDDATWSAWSQSGNWIRVDGGAGTYVLRGDFEIELSGLTGLLHAGPQARALDTGNTQTPAGPGLYYEQIGFARLRLHDAHIIIHVPAGGFASTISQTAQANGADAIVHGASGLVVDEGQTDQVAAQDITLGGSQAIGLMVSGDGNLAMESQALDADGNPIAPRGTAVELPSAFTTAALAASGVLVLGGAATYLFLHRTRRLPTLSDVEAALEAGAFRRAAREASAILRRNPASEDAFVSRLVALSRAGRHHIIVREDTQRIGRIEPSDGVQHYILGLSYRSLGRANEADAALDEAERRTPGLRAASDNAARPGVALSPNETIPGGYA